MERQEFATFAAALKTYFPRENLLPNGQAMELWYEELKDIPYETACNGLREHVRTNKFPPSIAEIRACAVDVSVGEQGDWGDGWEQVMMAIRKYGMYQEEKALESMDDITRRSVKRLGFQNICISENISADRANFRMMYESLQQADKKRNVVSNISTMIEQKRQELLMAER